MINQPIGIQNSPYNDFSGYKKNPNFVLNTQTPFNEENEHKENIEQDNSYQNRVEGNNVQAHFR